MYIRQHPSDAQLSLNELCDRQEVFSSRVMHYAASLRGTKQYWFWYWCVTRSQLLDAERSTNTPEKLSLALLQLMFTNTELAHGNCTKPVRDDIKQLDIERLWAIRCKYTGINLTPN